MSDFINGSQQRIADLEAQVSLADEIALAEAKAIDALSRYKFQMFGYWAAIWVHLNRIDGGKRPNPFAPLVAQARHMIPSDKPNKPMPLFES